MKLVSRGAHLTFPSGAMALCLADDGARPARRRLPSTDFVALLLLLAGCAAPSPAVARGAPPVEAIVLPPNEPNLREVIDAAIPFDARQASETLAHAYATGDEAAMRSIAKEVPTASAPGAGDDTTWTYERFRKEKWTESADDERFAVGMPSGLYLGRVEGARIEALLPEFGGVTREPRFLPDPNLVMLWKPPPVGSDACRLTWPEKDQPRFWLVDFDAHRVVLDRPGRVVSASPQSLLLSDGNESQLSLYDVTTKSERAVTFDPAPLRGNPAPWKPADCGASCSDAPCREGAPTPWSLRHDDVTFSSDGSTMALNWNGFSRGMEQGVSVHDVTTGAMLGSFVSMTAAQLAFLPKSRTLVILLASRKSKRPYHGPDTILLFDADKRGVRSLNGCTLAPDRRVHLGFSQDGAYVFVRWDLSGKARDSEGCAFEAVTARFVGKLGPGDTAFDDARFDDHREPPVTAQRVARAPARHVCSRGGFLFPVSACADAPAASPTVNGQR